MRIQHILFHSTNNTVLRSLTGLQEDQSGGVILCSIISLTTIFAVSYLTNVVGYKLPLIAYAGPFPVWCVFFVMGCYLRKCERNYSLLLPVTFVIMGLVMEYAETYYWNTNYEGGFGIKCSSFIYSIAIITLLFSRNIEEAYKRNTFTRMIEYIGSISFAIYLYHLYANNILSLLHITTPLPWILRWAICLVATILAIEFFKRIFPKKIHWIFGA